MKERTATMIPPPYSQAGHLSDRCAPAVVAAPHVVPALGQKGAKHAPESSGDSVFAAVRVQGADNLGDFLPLLEHLPVRLWAARTESFAGSRKAICLIAVLLRAIQTPGPRLLGTRRRRRRMRALASRVPQPPDR